jgi:hypothetical protein
MDGVDLSATSLCALVDAKMVAPAPHLTFALALLAGLEPIVLPSHALVDAKMEAPVWDPTPANVPPDGRDLRVPKGFVVAPSMMAMQPGPPPTSTTPFREPVTLGIMEPQPANVT